jgi:hypothetical protein
MIDGSSAARRIRLSLGALVRLAPGGSSILRLRRRGIAAARRRLNPVRPPLHTPERVVSLSMTPKDHPFITGNGLAAHCRYVINFDDLRVDQDLDNDWWFCHTDFVEYFFAKHEPPGEYVLFTHNSDRPIDRSLRRFLRRRRLRAWFAANAAVRHPKLHALPWGIANPHWPHGDGATLARVQAQDLGKTILFDASYDISTFPPAREYCRDQTGITPAPRRDFEEYLGALASSYFCIAPRGNGMDTHRVWEALYLRTVPVVTRTPLTEQHPDLPMIVLDDWSQFRAIDFSPELYERTIGGWTPESIRLDRYLERIARMIAAGTSANEVSPPTEVVNG